MCNSADFEKQWQYFVKKILLLSQKLSLCRFIVLSLYRNIARQNRSSDEGLKMKNLIPPVIASSGFYCHKIPLG
jgi:hypothetical protein